MNQKHITTYLITLTMIPIVVLTSCGKKSSAPSTEKTTSQKESTPQQENLSNPEKFPEIPHSNHTKNLPQDTVENLGMKIDFSDPNTIVEQLANILSNTKEPDDLEKITALIGKTSFSKKQLNDLKNRITEKKLQLDPNNPFLQIGQLKPGKHNRYAIQFSDQSRLFLDLKKQPDGNWKIENIQLPENPPPGIAKQPAPNIKTDSLNYTHTFLTHLLNQHFERARSMVDITQINDAKLAALCIIFEEGKYKLDPSKPLRNIILRDTSAGFYANLISNNEKTSAKFSIIAQRKNIKSPWLIHEINLDQLLEDYADRVADGDIHYTPLIKNPGGGETLVIYFEFDSNGLTPRTTKQLDIVVSLLKIDPDKKITISGHTDSKGSKNYNQHLSSERAKSVKDYLSKNGVPAEQILTQAYGLSKPRLPNQTAEGIDDPSGRRANRRTEIYLDF